MKKSLLLWMSALVLTMGGLSSCSSNDDEFSEPEDPSPEFAEGIGLNPRFTSSQTTTSNNGVEITRDSLGSIRWIVFQSKDIAPTSATALFSQYIGYDLEKDFRLYRQESNDWMENPIKVECYQQQYKGIILYEAGFNVRFQNGKVIDCDGVYVPVDNLDVTPSFSLQRAKEIYAKYLKVPVENVGTGGILIEFDDALMIAEFPVSKGSSQWAPRLVYALSYNGMHNEGFCFLDAHTGRILKTWNNYITNFIPF